MSQTSTKPTRLRGRRALAIGVLALLLGAILLVRAQGGGASAQPPPVAQVQLLWPDRARAGAPIIVELVASDAINLAGFEATIQYDPTSLRYLGATVQKDLAGGGRYLLPLGPVHNGGQLFLGAATCPVRDCTAGYPFQGARQPVGVSGRVRLATLTFQSEGGGPHTLSLADVRLVDPQGEPLAARTLGTLQVGGQP